jgi:hypothetical protein|tara:strand:- start:75 stop:320 length:246 start_codon:yes stop_codon:yes gene_type:complete
MLTFRGARIDPNFVVVSVDDAGWIYAPITRLAGLRSLREEWLSLTSLKMPAVITVGELAIHFTVNEFTARIHYRCSVVNPQ